MKRFALLVCLATCLLLCGCVGREANPLLAVEATDVPGVETVLHAAEASPDNAEARTVTLYFRYGEQPFLASEARALAVRRDETLERAIIEALLAGPSAENPALKALFPDAVELLEVSSGGDTLFVTFSVALLADGVPSDWQAQAEWATEAPLRRRLTMASLVCSLTENTGYTAVQVLLQRDRDAQTAYRLEQSYFLAGGTGVTEPMVRQEELLSTPYQAALRILAAWEGRDTAALSALIAGQPPTQLELAQLLDATRSLVGSTVSAGGVSPELGRAVVNLSLQTADAYGETKATAAYPLTLVWETGCWKIDNDALLRLLAR